MDQLMVGHQKSVYDSVNPINKQVRRKGHRIDVHRHAEKFLEEEAVKLKSVLPKPAQTKSLGKLYLENLVTGLTTMFSAIHL